MKTLKKFTREHKRLTVVAALVCLLLAIVAGLKILALVLIFSAVLAALILGCVVLRGLLTGKFKEERKY